MKAVPAVIKDWIRGKCSSIVPSTQWSLRRLRGQGFIPGAVIDCGAYEGEWMRMCMEVFPGTRGLMIEPQKAKEPFLAAVCARFPACSYSPALLGERPAASQVFYEMGSGSSVFGELSSVARKTIPLPVRTLDDVVAGAGFVPERALLKLDVQGSEAAVLRGGVRTLERVEFIVAEVSFRPYNQGAPLAGEVIACAQELGFRLYDIGSMARRPDMELLQADLFFKR
jgi:FkbM family methyltransferase